MHGKSSLPCIILKLPEHFVEDWNRYVTMDVGKAHAADDVVQLQAQQTGGLGRICHSIVVHPSKVIGC